MSKGSPVQLKDTQGDPISILGPVHSETATANITDGNPVSLAIPADTKFYELSATFDCYFDVDGTATTSSALFPRGSAVYKVLSGQTSVSMLRIDSADTGRVTLTPLG